jgi:hypothetical protein
MIDREKVTRATGGYPFRRERYKDTLSKHAFPNRLESDDWDRIAPYDYPIYLYRLKRIAKKKSLRLHTLGVLEDGSEILFLETQPASRDIPRILVAAGFHGEECGGDWGILHFLERTPTSLLKRMHLSCIPVVNPTGFRRGQRNNIWGESPNSGFCHLKPREPGPSREGKVLVNHRDLLILRAGSGFLSLHEDNEQSGFYLYTFERTSQPGTFTHRLKSTESLYFRPVADGIYDGARVNDGLAYRHCDGSFEDYLFHHGVIRTACTETPGTANLSIRVAANAALIEAFASFALSEGHPQTAFEQL